jgi:hypothetical protein
MKGGSAVLKFDVIVTDGSIIFEPKPLPPAGK